ncbi:MAG: zinc carboxypeptidase [Bacteroidetes bacterium]|nr:zinc carboxypeptidase [Bacteroidota bacterium]
MKNYCISLCLCLLTFFSNAQTSVPSPEKFLGYPLGSHFTPHFKIVNYFKQVAQSAPEMVKLEQYGETYEGRPLLLAFIALPENLQKLESIRLNNLRLAGMLNDKTPADENAPAIIWLSYNVHGNEAASSEASMKEIYELVNPDNKQTKEWLKNTVVVIDPCINPDGRDRYINWYNSVVGKTPNADPSAREHNEPWPGGRSNHYNFDLNRDWAWQTQIETQQRLKKYNEWFPQVHVDYHEQGYNAPYYFAPAAEPYHEVITPWQREFQQTIGRNNAKYFDQNGWLYFTKERFDLFYPSYGDTYPIYDGAIGMTFEQGGIRAGLAILTSSGDTLTLYDRLLHHFTTGMSTIEISSQYSARLIKEFHKYFINAKSTPYGEFKSYIVKNDNDGGRLDAVKTLLNRNVITWQYAANGAYTGMNYETGKQEAFKTETGDIVINCNQSKSNLIKVLFERNSRISDSATYDITAWSVPFVYGVKVYGAPNYINGSNEKPQLKPNDIPDNAYGYAINWTSFNSAKCLAVLLKKKIKVRYADQPFESGGRKFEKGTMLILKTSNKEKENNLAQIVSEAAKSTNVSVSTITSGFVDKGYDFGSEDVHLIHKPEVALLTGTGVSSSDAGEVWHFFEQQLDYPLTLINADDIGRMNWKNFNVLIMPDGNYKFLADKNVVASLKEWIRQGGKLIAVQNAVQQLAAGGWGIKSKDDDNDKKDNEDKKDDYSDLHKYETREREQLASSTPGSIYKVELDNTHPLAFGFPNYYYTLKQDDNIYSFLKQGGWNVGVIKKDNYVSGFTGSKAKEKLKDALVFGVQDMGRGQIIYLADNPLFRSFWENGKLLFCNAVFLVGE